MCSLTAQASKQLCMSHLCRTCTTTIRRLTTMTSGRLIVVVAEMSVPHVLPLITGAGGRRVKGVRLGGTQVCTPCIASCSWGRGNGAKGVGTPSTLAVQGTMATCLASRAQGLISPHCTDSLAKRAYLDAQVHNCCRLPPSATSVLSVQGMRDKVPAAPAGIAVAGQQLRALALPAAVLHIASHLWRLRLIRKKRRRKPAKAAAASQGKLSCQSQAGSHLREMCLPHPKQSADHLALLPCTAL